MNDKTTQAALDAINRAVKDADGEAGPEIKAAEYVYETDYGTVEVATILAELDKAEDNKHLTLGTADLVKHLFSRIAYYDAMPADPEKRWEWLLKFAAMNMGDAGAIVAGIVTGSEVMVTMQGDFNHRATIINNMSRQHKMEWHRQELEKLEKTS